MANRLGMDKSLAIQQLRAAGYSERRIAKTLGISRGAVRRHLADIRSNSTKAQTGSGEVAQTGSGDVAQTGSRTEHAPTLPPTKSRSTSTCEPFRSQILEMLELDLSAKRIHQDLVQDHEFSGKYWSVYRFVSKLQEKSELPFRRIEVEPGAELQVDFGTGARIKLADGKHKRTHVFRAVLSHSRKGYTESCFRQTTEDFIRVLENSFWALGGVPKTVVFDNAKCAVTTADWYDPELMLDGSIDGTERILDRYLKPDLLIIDDMGMKQLPKRSGEYLFEVIMRRHGLRSTMMTSNRPLEEWGKLLGDVPSATAILDRFLADSEVIQLTGRSYRLDKSQKTSNSTKAQTGSTAEDK